MRMQTREDFLNVQNLFIGVGGGARRGRWGARGGGCSRSVGQSVSWPVGQSVSRPVVIGYSTSSQPSRSCKPYHS